MDRKNGRYCSVLSAFAESEDGFDDWWHEKTIKPSMAPLVVSLEGSLKCHGCGKFFRVEKYVDGEVHCSVKRSVRQELN